ncbi:MAG: OmpA family protein [Puniceicoccales bacterium]|jgi:peptidoglycan-associated lipoprotein|nr:OmpA family protein [Puniceicoccales bacterium]
MLNKFVNAVCFVSMMIMLTGCSLSVSRLFSRSNGNSLTPKSTIIDIEDDIDECFTCSDCKFVAHGFDEQKTEYTYTCADVLESAYFGFDSANITPTERAKIRDIAKIFKKNKSSHVLLVGNCDKFGREQYNYSLGKRRADAVCNIFVESGVERSRITTASLGSCKAQEDVEVSEEAATDRRCDIVIHKL